MRAGGIVSHGSDLLVETPSLPLAAPGAYATPCRVIETFLNIDIILAAWPILLQGFGQTLLLSVLVVPQVPTDRVPHFSPHHPLAADMVDTVRQHRLRTVATAVQVVVVADIPPRSRVVSAPQDRDLRVVLASMVPIQPEVVVVVVHRKRVLKVMVSAEVRAATVLHTIFLVLRPTMVVAVVVDSSEKNLAVD